VQYFWRICWEVFRFFIYEATGVLGAWAMGAMANANMKMRFGVIYKEGGYCSAVCARYSRRALACAYQPHSQAGAIGPVGVVVTKKY
jgi:hypothetical protein